MEYLRDLLAEHKRNRPPAVLNGWFLSIYLLERYIPKNVFFLCEEVLIYDAPESATFPRMFSSSARRF
jgi:hypothetical protein